MNDITTRLDHVRTRIRRAEIQFGRTPGTVALVAISKGQPLEDVAALYHAGQIHFGENYLQEALPKLAALSIMDIQWHYTGAIQSNKTQPIAERFHWVQSIDRLKIAQRLSEQRPDHLPPLNICVQVNIGDERQKAGVNLAGLARLVHDIQGLPRLALRGLMAIPPPSIGFEEQRASFRAVRLAFEGLVADGPALDTLSMGMSADLEAAIAEGATMVRVGTAIFGARRREP